MAGREGQFLGRWTTRWTAIEWACDYFNKITEELVNTAERPVDSPDLLAVYERQLCTYAHILKRLYGKEPDREEDKKDALMAFPYRPRLVKEAGMYFDRVVNQILQKDFTIRKYPEPGICKECDIRGYCRRQ